MAASQWLALLLLLVPAVDPAVRGRPAPPALALAHRLTVRAPVAQVPVAPAVPAAVALLVVPVDPVVAAVLPVAPVVLAAVPVGQHPVQTPVARRVVRAVARIRSVAHPNVVARGDVAVARNSRHQ